MTECINLLQKSDFLFHREGKKHVIERAEELVQVFNLKNNSFETL